MYDIRTMRDLFLRACRCEPVERTPVWYMRQAGRFQPEYRALRERHGILEICRTPDLAAEVTLMPVRAFDVDAAILFSDIMVPVAAMGVDLAIDPGSGPRIASPIGSAAEVARLRVPEPGEDLAFVAEAVKLLVSELDVPLIGFSGAPFTLASYLIEGGPSRSFIRTKALMYEDPLMWGSLMDKLAETVIASLRAQADAGASAVQVFDSWVGALSVDDYSAFVLPHSRRIFEETADLGVPRIHFGVGTGELLEPMRDAGGDVVGVDWRVPLDRARARLGDDVAVQGNLDPALLLAPWDLLRGRAEDVLRRGAEASRTGHVFNLGHGVFPETDPDVVRRLTGFVHERSEELIAEGARS
jgi:uroporphyrinogen decarboxylase